MTIPASNAEVEDFDCEPSEPRGTVLVGISQPTDNTVSKQFAAQKAVDLLICWSVDLLNKSWLLECTIGQMTSGALIRTSEISKAIGFYKIFSFFLGERLLNRILATGVVI